MGSPHEKAQTAGWDVCPGPTPTASRRLEDQLPALEELTGHIATLRAMGVHVLYGEGGFIPDKPGEGRPDAYPWHLAPAAAEAVAGRRDAP
ncbi:hypothetical protein ABT010_00100 [Streptomyces sp. NPDC002668]|uniref:hypothetical protein n=1 Tax=Streptomyces sp. NPDC002668 TaxID=3154422 RepID=UPI00332A41E8